MKLKRRPPIYFLLEGLSEAAQQCQLLDHLKMETASEGDEFDESARSASRSSLVVISLLVGFLCVLVMLYAADVVI